MIHGLMSAGVWRDRRGVNPLDGGLPWYAVYETADGRHMAVGALEPQFYAEFVRLLLGEDEAEDLPDRGDASGWPALRQRFAVAFRGCTMDEWAEVFEGTDACVAPVVSLTEAAHHPHLAARQTFVSSHGVTQPAPAPRFSRTPAALGDGPPNPGAHTRAVLADWGVDDIDGLLDAGVVVQR
jgi:alpha-methylacyl-CoA racemase